MTPPDNKPAVTKDHDENQGSDNNWKTTSTRPPEQGLKCPRCDSPNTKFCYYNNYSLTQPRHFCKSCRRYWTKGGALRNVPIGGGCKKNKKVKSLPSSSSSRLSFDSRYSSPELLGGFKLFQGLSPSMDLQCLLPFPAKLHHHHHQYPPTTDIYTQFSSFGDTSASATSASCFQIDPPSAPNYSLTGLNYNPLFPSSSTGTGFIGAIQGTNSMNIHGNLASSIESLTSINQDLHRKLQQQRLAMMFGRDNQKDSSSVSLSPVNLENQTHQPQQPILFRNVEISKPGIFPAGNSRKESTSGDKPTEWFFGNSYSSVTPTLPTSSGGNGHDNASNNCGGVNAWGDVQQPYNALP